MLGSGIRGTINRVRQEIVPSKRRSRSTAAPAADYGPNDDARNILETYAELQLANFLKSFNLSSLPEGVHKLTGAGFTSVESLRALDPQTCGVLGFTDADAERLLLAAWLDGYSLHQYGETLVKSGCQSLLMLVDLTDEQLKSAGVQAIGHRRQLQRYLREDEPLQSRLDALRKEAEAEEMERRARMQRASGGAGSSSAKDKLPKSAEKQQQQQQASSLQFNVASLGGGAYDEQAVPDELDKVAGGGRRGWESAWSMEWRTTGNAALLGAAPGSLAEAHCEAQTPRDGFQLRDANGRNLMRVW